MTNSKLNIISTDIITIDKNKIALNIYLYDYKNSKFIKYYLIFSWFYFQKVNKH
jgi:hypothetical protein